MKTSYIKAETRVQICCIELNKNKCVCHNLTLNPEQFFWPIKFEARMCYRSPFFTEIMLVTDMQQYDVQREEDTYWNE